MRRYIDVEPFENALMAVQKRSDVISIAEVLNTLMKYPAAEVQEVRHGRWVQDGTGYHAKCSVCGEIVYRGWYYSFCPNCGAMMDEDEDIPIEYFENGGI